MYYVSIFFKEVTDMKDFRNNAAIVISAIKRYRYGPRVISLSKNCYDSLYSFIMASSLGHYSSNVALIWFEQKDRRCSEREAINARW